MQSTLNVCSLRVPRWVESTRLVGRANAGVEHEFGTKIDSKVDAHLNGWNPHELMDNAVDLAVESTRMQTGKSLQHPGGWNQHGFVIHPSGWNLSESEDEFANEVEGFSFYFSTTTL